MSEVEHLTPELFIDVLEKSPVDSYWLQHLETCRECTEELGGIAQALRIVRESESESESKPKPTRSRASNRLLGWAAAAVVLLGVGLYALTMLAPAPAPAPAPDVEVAETSILPPLAADEEFAVLLAMSSDVPTDSVAEAVEAGSSPNAPLEWELSELTPGELEALIERLATETEGRPGS